VNVERDYGRTIAPSDPLKVWVQIAVSGSVLLSSLYVILSQKFPSDATKWAFGTVGVILGYWLR